MHEQRAKASLRSDGMRWAWRESRKLCNPARPDVRPQLVSESWTMTQYSTAAPTVRGLLDGHGEPMDAVALRVGVNVSTISRIAAGKVRAKPDTVVALARVLGLSARRCQALCDSAWEAAHPDQARQSMIRRARELADAAPDMSDELREQVRQILAGAVLSGHAPREPEPERQDANGTAAGTAAA